MRRLSIFLILIVILTACGSPQLTQEDLGKKEWKLIAINGADPVAGADVTLNFIDGTLNGTTGCNVYSAGFSIDGNTIEVSEMILTMAFCDQPAGIMDQEIIYTQVLGGATQITMKDDQLTLTAADGQTLVFGE